MNKEQLLITLEKVIEDIKNDNGDYKYFIEQSNRHNAHLSVTNFDFCTNYEVINDGKKQKINLVLTITQDYISTHHVGVDDFVKVPTQSGDLSTLD